MGGVEFRDLFTGCHTLYTAVNVLFCFRAPDPVQRELFTNTLLTFVSAKCCSPLIRLSVADSATAPCRHFLESFVVTFDKHSNGRLPLLTLVLVGKRPICHLNSPRSVCNIRAVSPLFPVYPIFSLFLPLFISHVQHVHIWLADRYPLFGPGRLKFNSNAQLENICFFILQSFTPLLTFLSHIFHVLLKNKELTVAT